MKLTIPIDVVPQKRPRFYRGVAVDPAKSRKFKQDLAMLVKTLRRGTALLEGELSVELHIYRTGFRSVITQQYGDIDNLVKGIFDALTGVVWKDDRQISRLLVTKNQGDTPRVELTIEEVK